MRFVIQWLLLVLCLPMWVSAEGMWDSDRVIDAHAHLGSFEGYDLSLPTLLANIESSGVRLALVSNIDGAALEATANLGEEEANGKTLEAVRRHPDRLRGIAWARPVDGSAEALAPFFDERLPSGERVFVGLKLHPQMNSFPADDPRVDPYFELAARNYRPVVYHSGREGSFSDVERILAAARRHAKVPVVLYHMGFGGEHERVLSKVRAAIEAEEADVYLGTAQADPEAVLKAVQELGADRVLFGTDASYYGKGHYGRYEGMVKRLRENLEPLELAKVLGGNASRLFDLQSVFHGDGLEAAQVATTDRFDFHSSFWVNLHHFLYQAAYATGEWRDWRDPKEMSELKKALADPAERAAFESALEFYRREMVRRSFTYDYDLKQVNRRLASLNELSPTAFADLRLDVYPVLEAAAPIYRKHWWPTHDRGNRAWATGQLERLRGSEDTLADSLAKAYGGAWPQGKSRVDLVAYSNWAGAYTSSRPTTHIVLSSTNPGYQGLKGFEMLFHETSHSGSLINPVQEGLRSAFGKLDARAPRDLWHVVLFYTSGELVRRHLASQGIEYRPYGESEELYEGPWKALRLLLEGTWERYLKGEISRQEAFAALAEKWRDSQVQSTGGGRSTGAV